MTGLKFNKKKHIYSIGNRELTSVTTFIGQFFKPFNAKEIARKLAKFPCNKAKKHGVRYFLKEWKEAAEFGTRVHEGIEEHFRSNCFKADKRETDYIVQAINWFYTQKTIPRATNLEVEKIIYSEELGIAGTIDLLLYNGNTITLVDWKTSKAINKKAYKGEKGLKPLQEIDDCNYNKYTMQLSLYAYMLELQGYGVDKLVLAHLKEDKVKEYVVPYERELIIKMLEDKQNAI